MPPSWSRAADGVAEGPVRLTAERPKATTLTWSSGRAAPANACAAAMALASGAPRIDCDRSRATTMLFVPPRLTAESPATGCPFSSNRGAFEPTGATSVVRSDGYELASGGCMRTVAADAADAETSVIRKTVRAVRLTRDLRSRLRRTRHAPDRS